MIGRHSAIDRPDPVKRVTPPSTTIANTSAQQISNQVATARFVDCVLLFVFIGEQY
jgi:hypothetical protein